jgi:hypothetical protein
MTASARFDERARTCTQALLSDATRLPARVPVERPQSAPWKAITIFAATVLVIGGAVAGASIALHAASSGKPAPASHFGRWKAFQIPLIGGSLISVSCPDATICVAVDYGGNVYVSTNPGGGRAAWSVAAVDPSTMVSQNPNATMTGVSCADPSLCVAVDQSGNVVTSTNPGGGAGAWVLSGIDGQAVLSGVSCPDEHLCVAVGGFTPILNPAGVVLTSTNPAAGPGTWTATELGAAGALTAVSCPSAFFCVATDNFGDILTSTDPSGGGRTWRVTNVVGAPDSMSAISCPTVSLCVAVDSTGNVLTSTDPTGGARAWTLTNISADVTGLPLFDSVSCASAHFCVFGAFQDSVYMSTDPTGGSSAWIPVRVIPQGKAAMFGLSCPNTGFCVGVDGSGGFHVYTKPDA